MSKRLKKVIFTVFVSMVFLSVSCLPIVNHLTVPGGVAHAYGETVTVDNGSTGYATSGTWSTSTMTSGYYGTNYAVYTTSVGDSSKWAEWRPTLPYTGKYDVYMRWTASSNRPNAAPVIVKHLGGVNTTTVNQQTNGGEWRLVGTYTMASGTSNYVRITAGDVGSVIADAVRFVRVGHAELMYEPPSLDSTHKVIHVSTSGGVYSASRTEDVLLKFPSQKVTGRVQLTGGKNIRVIGGHIEVPHTTTGQALLFTNTGNGTIYIEGMIIDVSDPPSSVTCDGINVKGYGTGYPHVIIQNTKITGVKGYHSGPHGDGFQFVGNASDGLDGRGKLYMNNFEIDTSYQGLIASQHNYNAVVSTNKNELISGYFYSNTLTPTADMDLNRYIQWANGASSGVISTSAADVWMKPRGSTWNVADDHLFPNSVNVDHGSYVAVNHSSFTGRIEVGTPPGGRFTTTDIGAGYPGNTVGYIKAAPSP